MLRMERQSRPWIWRIGTLIISSSLLFACSKSHHHPRDPYESFNRKTFAFNQALDKNLLKPTAKAYKKVMPWPVREGVSNFFTNLGSPSIIVSDLLQADFNQAIKSTWRFAINSTLGLAGVVDVASHFNLKHKTNDLGVTFALWGDRKPPYLVLPFLGPSTIRDGAGLYFDYFGLSVYTYIKPTWVRWSMLGLYYVSLRSELLEAEDIIDGNMLDEYAFQRDAYLQHRRYLINQRTGEDDDPYVEANGQQDDPYVEEQAAMRYIKRPSSHALNSTRMPKRIF